jgi:hypoxanthine phosphoribosyltransferase
MKGTIKYRRDNYGRSFDGILTCALQEKRGAYLVGQMLDITQLYLNQIMVPVLSESRKEVKNPAAGQKTLEKLLSLDETVVAAFRAGRPMDIKKFWVDLAKISYSLNRETGFIAQLNPQSRYLEEDTPVLNAYCMRVLYKNLREKLNDINIDTIIYIANGGLEAALLVKMVKPAAKLIPLRYSQYRLRDNSPNIPNCMSLSEFYASIENKSILIIDDDIDTGCSMSKITHWIEKLKPKELYFGAAYTQSLRTEELSEYLSDLARKSEEIFHDTIVNRQIFEGRKGPGLYKFIKGERENPHALAVGLERT